MIRPSTAALLLAAPLVGGALAFQQSKAERTPPAAASGWTRTSTTAEVHAYLDTLAGAPKASLLSKRTIGETTEGRPMIVWTVAAPRRVNGADDRLRVFVNANIHGGEVEGKEAVQQLLTEFAEGQHGDLLEHLVIDFLPVYNADGNDRIARTNRVAQNGPVDGVGERANAMGLDLNRDFIKVEAPETKALLTYLNRVDPLVFMDLHTTNGTDHGYHLTYATSLATGQDEEFESWVRTRFLPQIKDACAEVHDIRAEEYGWLYPPAKDDAGEPVGLQRWRTYDHRPRFGTNLMGLRNRIAVLSEAFSYADFETRARATHAFVLETLRRTVRDRARIVELCAAADARAAAGRYLLPIGARHEDGVPFDLLLCEVEEVEVELPDGKTGKRRAATDRIRSERTQAQVGFDPLETEAITQDWAILPGPWDLEPLLRFHGLRYEVLDRPRNVDARRFQVTETETARREFQGHHERTVKGNWTGPRTTSLPAGTILVPHAQPRGREAAWMLEPRADDSLWTWNVLDVAFKGEDVRFPILRVRR